MESADSKMMERIRIYTKVSALRELTSKQWVRGVGKDAEFKEVSFGWYLFLEGSWEGVNVGTEKPFLEVGDKVEIRIRKVNK